MHSSRMHTAGSLTVSCPPWQPCTPPQPHMPPWQPHMTQQPCMPPTTMHTPQSCMPPRNHTCPLAIAHALCNHACPPATMHAPPQPCMPPGNHACPPCGQNSWHTLLKILPCPKLLLRAVIKVNNSDLCFCYVSGNLWKIFNIVGPTT